MEKTFVLPEFNYMLKTGNYARQADQAVWFQQGNTILFATIVEKPSKDFLGFLPLTVDYREEFSATGKIPGGYYKREASPSDEEILTSRLIDRAIRPLFPAHYFDEVQIIITAYSIDLNHMPQPLALLAASSALVLSKVPFLDPVGALEVGHINGQWILNPTLDQHEKSDTYLMIAGNDVGICMLEGSLGEISEQELLPILTKGHQEIKKQVAWQKKINHEIGKEKKLVSENKLYALWSQRVQNYLTDNIVDQVFKKNEPERQQAFFTIKHDFFKAHTSQLQDNTEISAIAKYSFQEELKKKITERIFAQKKRFDGRTFDEIRSIGIEVDIFPQAHGSSMFSRGDTQAFTTATLGTRHDELEIDDVMAGTMYKSFFLQYNFLPFSVGQIGHLHGPNRREIGHSHLAERALKHIIPNTNSFPYTIRIVTDIIESNGSSSMSTVCGGMMALMSAGIPVKKMVSGIAIGLLEGPDGTFQTLTDIAGKEDEYGLLDFKIAGTIDGITAIQMDTKYKNGLPQSILETALRKAREGRLLILKEMQKVLSAPNPLSPLAPHSFSSKTSKE